MTIVILAHANDNHTAPIKWALEQAGYKVACWAGLASTDDRQASIAFEENTQMTLGTHVLSPGDVVWVRRPNPPLLNPRVSEADRKFAEGEYRWFYHSIMYQLETLPVHCINKYSASRFINNKSVQILLARDCGMHVPKTLFSNSPAAVRAFVQEAGRRSICKAFFPHIWKKDDSEAVAVTETFEVSPEMLPADEVLTYAPAIYQEMVVKEFDVRMVVMGSSVYSYALRNPKGALDWRQDAGQGLVQVENIETPADVEKAVIAFMRQSGAVFGSLDFAIDEKGQWWFLEINEQGQFLWLDEFNRTPDIMGKFLAFLTAPDSSRHSIEERQSLFPSLKDYRKFEETEQPQPEEIESTAFVSTEP
jgi:glutathione synthase/RimK-type ligase-like ATP-grasp enzyme